MIAADRSSDGIALSERVIARLADDWRSFHAQTGAVEIAVELPIACLRDPVSVATLCRQLPDHRAFTGLIIEINAAAAVRELGLVKAIAKQLRFRNIAISIRDVGDEWLPLSKLHDFPFVELKVDRRLVAGCAHDRSKLATCRPGSGSSPQTLRRRAPSSAAEASIAVRSAATNPTPTVTNSMS